MVPDPVAKELAHLMRESARMRISQILRPTSAAARPAFQRPSRHTAAKGPPG